MQAWCLGHCVGWRQRTKCSSRFPPALGFKWSTAASVSRGAARRRSPTRFGSPSNGCQRGDDPVRALQVAASWPLQPPSGRFNDHSEGSKPQRLGKRKESPSGCLQEGPSSSLQRNTCKEMSHARVLQGCCTLVVATAAWRAAKARGWGKKRDPARVFARRTLFQNAEGGIPSHRSHLQKEGPTSCPKQCITVLYSAMNADGFASQSNASWTIGALLFSPCFITL